MRALHTRRSVAFSFDPTPFSWGHHWVLGSLALAFDGSGEEAAGQPALHDREEKKARDRREQRGRRERAEANLALDADELGELDGKRHEPWGLQQDEREEKLVPRRDEREQQGDDDAGGEERGDDPHDDLDAAGA